MIIYIYIAPGGDTLYISGTKHVDSIIKNQLRAPGYGSLLQSIMNNDFQDVYDDLKIPLNLTRYSQRYIEADKALKANPQINKLIGHSLGGSVSLELEKIILIKLLKLEPMAPPFGHLKNLVIVTGRHGIQFQCLIQGRIR